MIEIIKIKSNMQYECLNLNQMIQEVISKRGLKTGVCIIYNPHSTAGLFINSYLDPKTLLDIMDTIRSLVPTRIDFHHQFDTPSDAAGHIKSVLVGNSETVLVENGSLCIGGSQGILFAEFDGPREREVWITFLNTEEAR
jgi:secondary thiamine-phosphate synthase enzyme